MKKEKVNSIYMHTEIVFILDKSASMHGQETQVIKDYNDILIEQQTLQDDALLTTLLFDTTSVIWQDGISISEAKPLNAVVYHVKGRTLLFDTIGQAIKIIEQRIDKQKEKYQYINEDILVIINTDGHDNASKKYTKNSIKQLIEKKKESKWTFIYLGADINNTTEAENINIHAKDRLIYEKKNQQTVFKNMSSHILHYRNHKKLPYDWNNNMYNNIRKTEPIYASLNKQEKLKIIVSLQYNLIENNINKKELKMKFNTSEFHSEIMDTYKVLGGIQEDYPVNMGKWDISTKNFNLELDEQLHFNRYRNSTLTSKLYKQLKGVDTDTYIAYCKNYEQKCINAGAYGKKWTTNGSEVQFGISNKPGNLEGNGSARWKQRAFYDYLKDISYLVTNKLTIRISIYDTFIYKGNTITIEEALKSVDFMKYAKELIELIRNMV